MIIFNSSTSFGAYYNYKIHQFLEVEFDDHLFEMHLISRSSKRADHLAFFNQLTSAQLDELKEELSPFFMERRLLDDDLQKCFETALDLFDWTQDQLPHPLDNLHSYALYGFLLYMEELADDLEFFDDVYFNDTEDEEFIANLWQHLDREQYDVFTTVDELRNYLHDVNCLLDECFEDIDFITFSEMICSDLEAHQEVPADLLAEYAELVPQDILAHYQKFQSEHDDSLFRLVGKLLDEFARNLIYRREHQLMWEGEHPKHETQIQFILASILRYGFYGHDVLIDRGADVGVGETDLRLLDGTREPVLIEVKKLVTPSSVLA